MTFSASISSLSNPRPVDAVIWDYDGTLVDSRAADEAAVAELIDRDPSAASGAAVFWALEGRPIIERLECSWPGRVDEVLPLFDSEAAPRCFVDVKAVIDGLRRRGFRLAVVSSRRVDPLERGLRACRLRSAFTAVVGLESVSTPKPDPEGLLLACALIGACADRAVYIGDQPVDVEAGRAAAMPTWRAAWSRRPAQGVVPAIELHHPRDVIARLDALMTRGRLPDVPPLAAAG